MTDPLVTFALSFPEAWEDHPWGETVIKVKAKIFLFFRTGDDGTTLSVKLPSSMLDALALPFCQPTGYGLGRSGWVTARLPPGDRPDDLLRAWIDESWRAVAPKRLVKSHPPA
jgi:predicted DNA-binding protein (MmcQ/YjbR family)